MRSCPAEFEIMRDAKIKVLRLQNPYLAPTEDESVQKGQSQKEQMQMVTMANAMMDGDS